MTCFLSLSKHIPSICQPQATSRPARQNEISMSEWHTTSCPRTPPQFVSRYKHTFRWHSFLKEGGMVNISYIIHTHLIKLKSFRSFWRSPGNGICTQTSFWLIKIFRCRRNAVISSFCHKAIISWATQKHKGENLSPFSVVDDYNDGYNAPSNLMSKTLHHVSWDVRSHSCLIQSCQNDKSLNASKNHSFRFVSVHEKTHHSLNIYSERCTTKHQNRMIKLFLLWLLECSLILIFQLFFSFFLSSGNFSSSSFLFSRSVVACFVACFSFFAAAALKKWRRNLLLWNCIAGFTLKMLVYLPGRNELTNVSTREQTISLFRFFLPLKQVWRIRFDSTFAICRCSSIQT